VDAFQGYVAANSSGGSLRWSRAYPMSLIGWNLWVVFVPLILRLVRGFPIDRGSWRRSLIVFTFAGIFFASARSIIPVLINFLVLSNPAFLKSYLATKYFDLISDFLVAVVVYALIITFGQALSYYKRYREHEVKASRLAAQLAQSQLVTHRISNLQSFFVTTRTYINSFGLNAMDPSCLN
jgi:hypothetical protein